MAFETDLVLIDVASLAWPIYATSTQEPNIDYVSQSVAAKVRELAGGHPHVVICYDGGGHLFRKELDPTYKGNRPERNDVLQKQISIARQDLANQGFPVWGIAGFEADDVIASAVTQVLEKHPDLTMMIVSADKDLYQLVGPTVSSYKVSSQEIFTPAMVEEKFGVPPALMLDYLCLVGDASDNVKGVAGIGEKKAPLFLKKWGSVAKMIETFRSDPAAIASTPKGLAAFQEFVERADTVRKLITLRTDLDLPLHEWFEDRRDRVSVEFEPALDGDQPTMLEEGDAPMPEDLPDIPFPAEAPKGPAHFEPPPFEEKTLQEPAPKPEKPRVVSMAKKEAPSGLTPPPAVVELLPPPPTEREWHLQPRSMSQAQALAMDLFKSGMLDGYGTPHAVLSSIILGQELGLPVMTALGAIHVINGRHSLSAQLIVARVLQSGLAEFFEPLEVGPTRAIFETKRKGARKAMKLEHTIEMATAAGLVKPNSNWVKSPTDMLVARCSVRLARLIYPDVVTNLYSRDEIEEIKS